MFHPELSHQRKKLHKKPAMTRPGMKRILAHTGRAQNFYLRGLDMNRGIIADYKLQRWLTGRYRSERDEREGSRSFFRNNNSAKSRRQGVRQRVRIETASIGLEVVSRCRFDSKTTKATTSWQNRWLARDPSRQANTHEERVERPNTAPVSSLSLGALQTTEWHFLSIVQEKCRKWEADTAVYRSDRKF
ncbi:unnamed protein product [Heligmosomoides polygyrus]|uniref:Uncharacterized protein n=1 Tax=Heligmosomoides polygyrus TaxID=6339 RepID=A0A183F7M6_HELPZ|nr:unnamed protein product [Heligmosomoides polygyrus]